MAHLILAQMTGEMPYEELPYEGPIYEPTFWERVYFWTYGWSSLLYFAFLIWMVIYCIRSDPERYLWLWIILLFQPFGAVIYFFARYLPSADISELGFVKRMKKAKQMDRLRIAANQIGNAYQHVQLGDAARELGRDDESLKAYQSALAKEPENLAALWGAASIEFREEEFESALAKLSKVLEKDSTYKFGDVSLLYGKTLLELDRLDEAKSHLEGHIPRWRQPEALYLLAKICLEQQQPEEAKTHLRGLIDDIDASPRAIARKNLFWKGRAKRLLRKVV